MRIALIILFCEIITCYAWDAISKTTIITPKGGIESLNEALSKASAGDTLLLKKGVYNGKININRVKGLPGFPVVIKGEGNDSCFINGNSLPGLKLEKFGCHIIDSKWIVIENLQFYNCWTDIIKVNYSNYISIKNCKATGGRRFVYATSFSSHHFLIENCEWEQDEKVWTHENGHSWEELHHGEYVYYNGSIFQGVMTSGVFVIRNNIIRNTFNAFRISQVLDGQIDYLTCSNGEIYGNLIINTSDNVLEPENYCSNLHFYHNRLINGHAFISVTEVGGGPIYLYGNTGLSEEGCDDGWTIFKISNETRSLDKPFYIFNNSWCVDYDIVGSPRHIWKNNHVKHFNNAYFIKEGDQFGIYNLGENIFFDHDCSNLAFPPLLTENSFEQNGIVASPQFIDAEGGDFRLKSTSPCINTGLIPSEFKIKYNDELTDIGCYQGEELIEGPPFRYEQPAVSTIYTEKPRIVRHQCEQNKLTVWFSVPLQDKEYENTFLQLNQDGKSLTISDIELTNDNYALKIQTTEEIDKNNISLAFVEWPIGENNETATDWASTINITPPLYGQTSVKDSNYIQKKTKFQTLPKPNK